MGRKGARSSPFRFQWAKKDGCAQRSMFQRKLFWKNCCCSTLKSVLSCLELSLDCECDRRLEEDSRRSGTPESRATGLLKKDRNILAIVKHLPSYWRPTSPGLNGCSSTCHLTSYRTILMNELPKKACIAQVVFITLVLKIDQQSEAVVPVNLPRTWAASIKGCVVPAIIPTSYWRLTSPGKACRTSCHPTLVLKADQPRESV